jgi:hypothetical protein
MTRDNYVSLRLRTDVGPELRRLTRQVAATADRDVNQSDAVIAAIRYALGHLGEVAAMLPGEADDGDSSPEETQPREGSDQ